MRVLVLLLLAVGCLDSSTFAGDYEVTATRTGACDGALADTRITDPYFRLAEVDGLIAYYPCTAPGKCDDVYDLARSFGGDREGHVATAIPGCTLSYRVRVLAYAGDGIAITERHYSVMDPSATCTQEEARARGEEMPCIDTTEIDAQ